MTHADTLEEQLVELRLQVDDIERNGAAFADAVKTLEERIERLERKLSHKGGAK